MGQRWRLLVLVSCVGWVTWQKLDARPFSESDFAFYRKKVHIMFQHAYTGYLQHAYPYDELRPLSCDGINTWGKFSLTLIDSLDTLVVMGNYSEFRRVAKQIINTIDIHTNINVSVFETNIRVVGGLLSAHLLSRKAGMELAPGWPCSGPLLELAENIARRLLPAFHTKTGMPYGTVNLKYGVPNGETPITCTAGVSTFIVEFGTLSRLTGDPVFEETAMRALNRLWTARSSVGLIGNHINVEDGKWTALDAGIGAGVDSYFEYLVKGAILLQRPELMEMFQEHKKAITKYMKRDDWYMWVSMASGHVTMPIFQSLEAYWPGLLTLVGDITQAQQTLYNYHQVWKQYGFTPEFYDIPNSQANKKREGYPLRPELIESIMYLYRATKDPTLLQMGVDILESIEHSSKTECGFATVKNVKDHKIEDRMESFFLAETTKYLYLLFDEQNFIHNNGSCGKVIQTTGHECLIEAGGYVFNTEAHPIDVAAVYCCSAEKHKQDDALAEFERNVNLLSVLGIVPDRRQKTFTNANMLFKAEKKEELAVKRDTLVRTVDSLPKYQNLNDTDSSSVATVKISNLTLDLPYQMVGSPEDLYNKTAAAMDIEVPVAAYTKEELQNTAYETVEEAMTVLPTRKASKMAKVESSQAADQSATYGRAEVFEVNINQSKTDMKSHPAISNQRSRPVTKASKMLPWEMAPLLSKGQAQVVPVVLNFEPASVQSNLEDSHGNTSQMLSDFYHSSRYDVLFCPAQPYSLRISVMGEMFEME